MSHLFVLPGKAPDTKKPVNYHLHIDHCIYANNISAKNSSAADADKQDALSAFFRH